MCLFWQYFRISGKEYAIHWKIELIHSVGGLFFKVIPNLLSWKFENSATGNAVNLNTNKMR